MIRFFNSFVLAFCSLFIFCTPALSRLTHYYHTRSRSWQEVIIELVILLLIYLTIKLKERFW